MRNIHGRWTAPVAVSTESRRCPAAPAWASHDDSNSWRRLSAASSHHWPPSGDYLRFDDLRARCAHPVWHPDPNVNVFGNERLSPHGAEQFRTLRSRLYQLRTTQNLRTLLITSSVPGEGKTFVTTNLAQAIVRQPDRRALIIDGDLRCARLHVPLGAPNSPGLSDYLRGEADELAVIQHGAGRESVLYCGRSEGDRSQRIALERAAEEAAGSRDARFRLGDYRFATLPAGGRRDHSGQLLRRDSPGGARGIDGEPKLPNGRCQELQGKNVIGVVLNAVEQSHMYGSYYYQGYGYGEVYGQSEKEKAKKN